MILPRISVITVVYNNANGIENTIISILNQNYQNVEYIIIDGASTDGTVDIIKKYENHIHCWISEPDRGLYDAMNKGLKRATGEYIMFLNSGDLFYNSEVLANIFKNEKNFDVFYGDTKMIDEKNIELGPRRLQAPKSLTWKSFRKGMLVSHQALIIKRELISEYDLQYCFSSDFDWVIKILRKAKKICNTGLVITASREGGVTKQNLLRSLKERFLIMKKNYGLFPTLINHAGFFFRFTVFYFKHRRF